MDYYKSLESVDVKLLSPRVLVLLSKYARELRKENGMILKLNSDDIFKDVHNTSMQAGEANLLNIYSEILTEVNRQNAQPTEKKIKTSHTLGYFSFGRQASTQVAT